MTALVPLHIEHMDGWHAREEFRPTAVRKAAPLWRCRSGYLMHRPRSGRVYLHDRGRITMTWWCGNMAHSPIPVKPQCMDGLEPCLACEVRWQKAGSPA